ncbi:helix-turn-helix domain-containing protein [Seongchinamella sediminis]|uniref:Helix-turn-helix domain-containing protein n=1 Tax=Seongchinamella sediminis TaxID=2283635 RepID=A0A3L7DYD4_9GAMM|nr:AraC family transcriptional regulator [Seongchinamella sediminis]RLQ21675.1 helix-turn-helix domain-containing protein [Seongchinamella sediminis]
MSKPSQWPLPEQGIRFLTPAFMVEKLARHPLTKDCYPTAMGYYPAAAGHRMQRERHDDNLLLYCTAGGGILRAGDWSGEVAPGNIMLLPQGLAHAYQADPIEPWTLYWAHFQGASTGILMQYLGYREGRPLADAGVSPLLIGAFTSLLEVRRTGYSTRAFINAANQLRHLLTQISLEMSAHAGRLQTGFELEHVQAYMLEHIDQPLTLDALAQVANMSKYHFSSRYKALTGYSPIRHFLNMKIEHACHLLDTTELGVGEIARRVGYEDPLYFSRLFRQTIGSSARQYRASSRK